MSVNEKPGKKTTLGILVTSSPESENRRTLLRIAGAAIDMGHGVKIFLMCDGVYHILQKNFLSLVERGSEVTLCAHNASERGLQKQPGVLFGSQYDLAKMMSDVDRFLAFT